MHSQRHFGELGTHAQQSRAPHPEHRTRPADGDRARHAGDVAGADGSGQRRTHRLERSHRAVGGVLFAEDAANGRFDGIGEFPELQKACPRTEQQAHADDADHRRDAPDKAVDRLIDGCDGFEHTFTPFFFTLTQRKLFYFLCFFAAFLPVKALHKPRRLCYDKGEISVWHCQPQGDVMDV